MRLRLKHVLVALVALLCLAFAYSPVLQAGLLAADYGALLEAEQARLGAPASGVAAKPLAHLSLAGSNALWGLPLERDAARGSWSAAFPRRLENLAFLLVACAGLAAFLRRLLLPWIGNVQASGAASTAGLALALHPLSVAAVADVASRGDLLGVALCSWCAAAFLRGRQDRLGGAALVSFALAAAAAFSSDLALGIAPVLFAAELFSSHRYRPLRTRLRTAATSFVIFGAASSCDLARQLLRHGEEGWPPALAVLRSGELSPTAFLEGVALELGVLVLPVNGAVLGLPGYALAGALFLLALQPAMLAARTAPRLWGWMLSSWLVFMVLSGFLHAHVGIHGDPYWETRLLLPSVAVMAAGLGLASTALANPRRPVVAWVVAVGLAALAHGNGRPWLAAASAVDELRVDLIATAREVGTAPVWVLDPPREVQGVRAADARLSDLIHPRLAGAGEADGAASVRGVDLDGFLALAGEPEGAAFASAGGVVLFAVSALDPGEAPVSSDGPPVLPARPGGRRAWRALARPDPTTGQRSWTGTLSSPSLDLATWSEGAVRVTVPAEVDPAELEWLSWRTKGSSAPDRGWVRGVWRRVGAEQVGVFDLGSRLGWRLGGRARRLLFEQGTQSIRGAEVLARLPALTDAAPVAVGDDWRFELSVESAPPPAEGGFSLGLLDTELLAWRSVPLEVGEEEGGRTVLWARGLARELAGPAPAGRWLWILDYRIDGHAVFRSRGRLP